MYRRMLEDEVAKSLVEKAKNIQPQILGKVETSAAWNPMYLWDASKHEYIINHKGKSNWARYALTIWIPANRGMDAPGNSTTR